MNYTIQRGDLSVTVSDVGAELQSVRYLGKERIWQNEDGSWTSHAPILFPVCGHCGVTVNGRSYPIGSHGVARRAQFHADSVVEDRVTFSLTSDESTRERFPYDFIFSVSYQIVLPDTVGVTYSLMACGKTDLPASFGAHDSFALEKDLSHYSLEFDLPEHFLHHCHDSAGYLTDETIDFGSGRELPLPADFLTDGRTLIFSGLHSRAVTLKDEDGRSVAAVTFPDYENLLLWHPGNSRMICVEPWRNLPDRANMPDPEFSTKGGVVLIPRGKTATFYRTVRYFS